QVQGNGSCAQSEVFLVSFLSNFCCIVITNMTVQCSNQHEAIFQVVGHLLLIGLHASNAMLLEATATISHQFDGLKNVVNNHWLKYVELQVTLAGGNINSDIIA